MLALICARRAFLLCLLVLGVALAGCSSPGAGRGAAGAQSRTKPSEATSSEAGGLWGAINQDLSQRASRGEDLRRAAEATQASVAALPPGWKERIDAWWALWMRTPADVDPALASAAVVESDPERLAQARRRIEEDWLRAREEWEELGPRGVNILVENLLRWYFLAYERAIGFEVARSKEELLRYQDIARQYLVLGLGSGSGDDVLRKRGAELLAWFGPEGLPEIESGYGRAGGGGAESIRGRWALLLAVRQMRSTKAVPLLTRVAADEGEDWMVRAQAIGALGEVGDPRGIPVLARLLRDDDASIRKFAATFLGAIPDLNQEALLALVATVERDRDADTQRAAVRSLSRALKVNHGLNAAAWRQAVAQRGEGRR